MTKKRRDDGARKAGSGQPVPTAPAAEAAATEPMAVEPPAVEPAGRLTLPAFGFAADILASRGKQAAQPAKPAPRRGQAAAPAARLAGPDRIFAFADSLAEDESEETEAVPVVLETWVTLVLHGETFALPVDSVREVLRVSQITRVPHAPRPIRGVTNLRGRVIPVIDLRLRLELPQGELERSHRIVVVESRGRLIGLLVDAVRQVVHIDLNKVEPAPDDVMTVQSDYILGVYHQGEDLILLLDVDRVLIVKEAATA